MAEIDRAFEVKHGLSIENINGVFSGSSDPSITGFDAPVASLYLRYSSTDYGIVYYKFDVGTTDWRILEGSSYASTSDPTVNWDSADTASVGYNFSPGSYIVNTSTGRLWFCIDSTPTAAVWSRVISENVDYIQFDTTSGSSTAEGSLSWNSDDGTLQIGTDISDFQVQVGQETTIRCVNKTLATIPNGSIVYINGAQGNRPTIALADLTVPSIGCKTIGMVTHNIANNDEGMVTVIGLVRQLNTDSFTVGDAVYLSETPGQITNIPPSSPSSTICIGYVLVSHLTQGVVLVKIRSGVSQETLIDTKSPSGFINNTEYTLSFDNVSRTFTIAPAGDSFSFYSWGKKYIKETSVTQIIPNSNGAHYIYFDEDGNIQTTATFNNDIIRKWCFVAEIYWNVSLGEGLFFHEDHGSVMSPETHFYLHTFFGSQYKSGAALNSILVDENGSLDAHAQFGVEGGVFYDEDIMHSISAVSSTSGLRILYLDGTTWSWGYNSGFSFFVDGGTNRLLFNDSGSQTVVGNGNYVLSHIAMTPIDGGEYIAIQGQNEYSTVSQAREGALVEIGQLQLEGLPNPEFVIFATVIFETKGTYSSGAAIVSTGTGDDYVDFRLDSPNAVNSIVSHNSLSDLSYTASGHTGFGRLAYSTTTDPTVNNDDVDTAGTGRTFRADDRWLNTSSGILWVCMNNTTGSALWKQLIGDEIWLTDNTGVDGFVIRDEAGSLNIYSKRDTDGGESLLYSFSYTAHRTYNKLEFSDNANYIEYVSGQALRAYGYWGFQIADFFGEYALYRGNLTVDGCWRSRVVSDEFIFERRESGTFVTKFKINTNGINLVNTIDEFSTDGTLSGDSDTAVPTEKAVKAYVDNNSGSTLYEVTQSSHGFSELDVIYFNGTSWAKAQANSASTIGTHIVANVIDTNTFEASFYGVITSTSHGLTVGDYYFTSEGTAGALVDTEPSQYSNPMIFVLNSNELLVLGYRPSEPLSGSSNFEDKSLYIAQPYVVDGIVYFAVPKDITISKIRGQVLTAPTGSGLRFSLDHAAVSSGSPTWTPIIDATTEYLEITASSYSVEKTSSFNSPDISEDDVIRLNIEQVGSTEPGKDLIVLIEYRGS